MQELEQLNKKNNQQFVTQIKNIYGTELKQLFLKKNTVLNDIVKPENIYFIEQGTVIRSFTDTEGNTKALDLLSEREIVGLVTLYGPVPLHAEVRTLTDVVLTTLSSDLLKANLQISFPMICSNYQYSLSILYLNWQSSLSAGSERINYALIALSFYIGTQRDSMYLLPTYVTHQVIADFAAVSRSYVTRHLKILARKNIISKKNNNICILNILELIHLTPNYQTY